jgi:Protein of unknown function (DUF3224)
LSRFLKTRPAPRRYMMSMIVKGSFDVKMTAEPPFDDVDGVTFARATFDKVFTGPLAATSKVHFLGVRTKVPTSAAYVAIERIVGVLDGKKGTFAVTHLAGIEAEGRSLAIRIIPDSGTGEVAGIRGRMDIQIVEGKHFYELDYEL